MCVPPIARSRKGGFERTALKKERGESKKTAARKDRDLWERFKNGNAAQPSVRMWYCGGAMKRMGSAVVPTPLEYSAVMPLRSTHWLL